MSNIKFVKDTYKSAIKQDKQLADIVFQARTSTQFKYGECNFIKFLKVEDKKNYLGRKVYLIPSMLSAFLFKGCYHLAKAIFIGIPKTLTQDKQYIKFQFYYLARDYQEAYGNLIALFNVKKGLYHLQESRFQKTCYDTALWKVKPTKNIPDSHLNLFNYHTLNCEEVNRLFKKKPQRINKLEDVHFQQAACKFNDEHFKYVSNKKLNLLNYHNLKIEQLKILFFDAPKRLEKLSLMNFKIAVEHFDNELRTIIPHDLTSSLNLMDMDETALRILLSEANFQTTIDRNYEILFDKLIEYKSLWKYLSYFPNEFLKRIDYTDEKLTEEHIKYLLCDEEKVAVLEENFKKVLKKFPLELYAKIPTSFLNWLDYATLTQKHIICLFPAAREIAKKTNTRFKNRSQEIKKEGESFLRSSQERNKIIHLDTINRIAFLNEDNFKQAVKHFMNDLFKFIPEKFLTITVNAINQSKIPDKQKSIRFNNLFCYDIETNRKRMEVLKESDFLLILQHLYEALYFSLPDRYINLVDYKTTSQSAVQNIFFRSSSRYDRISCLSITQFKEVVLKFEDDNYFLDIPAKFLNILLDTMDLDKRRVKNLFSAKSAAENRKRIECLTENNYKKVVQYLPKLYRYTSPLQIQFIDFKSISDTHLKCLFSENDEEHAKILFAKLEAKDVLQIWDKLSNCQKGYVTRAQFSHKTLQSKCELWRKEKKLQDKYIRFKEQKKPQNIALKPDYDPYAILGLSKKCSFNSIKAIYKKLALAHHPDRHMHPNEGETFEKHQIRYKEAETRFKEIDAAYKQICDEFEK